MAAVAAHPLPHATWGWSSNHAGATFANRRAVAPRVAVVAVATACGHDGGVCVVGVAGGTVVDDQFAGVPLVGVGVFNYANA